MRSTENRKWTLLKQPAITTVQSRPASCRRCNFAMSSSVCSCTLAVGTCLASVGATCEPANDCKDLVSPTHGSTCGSQGARALGTCTAPACVIGLSVPILKTCAGCITLTVRPPPCIDRRCTTCATDGIRDVSTSGTATSGRHVAVQVS